MQSMKISKLIIVFIVFTRLLFTQLQEKDIPKCVDISVAKIIIDSVESSIKVLGNDIRLNEKDFTTNYYNNDKTELLTLYFHPGNEKDSFSEFKVQSVNQVSDKIKVLKEIIHFSTGKQIRLGISKKQLTNIFGTNFTEKSRRDTITIEYHLNLSKYPKFQQYYYLPSYYGFYKFHSDKLIEYKFGFENP